jgi:hypothetical protein
MCMSAPKMPPPPKPIAPPPPPTKVAEKVVNPAMRRKRQAAPKRSPLTIPRSALSSPQGGTGVNYK